MQVTTVMPLVLLMACAADPVETGVAESASTNTNVTKIKINGRSSDVILVEASTDTNGFLNASKDNIANTSALDFSYATPTANPDIIILLQGAGEIPNSAYTTGATSAHLVLSATPFPTTSCNVNLVTGDFNCTTGPVLAFNLTWVQNGFASVQEKLKRREQTGPIITDFKGEFDQQSALVNGTWGGHVASNLNGNTLDTQNVTATRDITRPSH